MSPIFVVLEVQNFKKSVGIFCNEIIWTIVNRFYSYFHFPFFEKFVSLYLNIINFTAIKIAMRKFTAISIDDDPIFILLLKKIFANIPYIDLIETHTNPVAGVLAVVNKEPDFLFLDMEMPMIDGFEAIQMLKKRPITIVITSHDLNYAGIDQINPDATLTKPIKLEAMDAALKNLIQIKGLV